MRRFQLLLWPAGAVLGLAAEWVKFGWGDPRHWIPDLAAGWCLIACGLIAWSRRPESGSGALMAATGFAWFVGNFSAASWEPLAWLGEQAAFVYLGVLLHCVVSYPSGRLSSRLDLAPVGAGYVLAVLTPQAVNPLTIAIAVLLVTTTVYGYLQAHGPARRARLPAAQMAVFAGFVFTCGSAAHLAYPAGDADAEVLLAYQVTLCVVAIVLLNGLLGRPRANAEVAARSASPTTTGAR